MCEIVSTGGNPGIEFRFNKTTIGQQLLYTIYISIVSLYAVRGLDQDLANENRC